MRELSANINLVGIWKQDSWESVEYYNKWFMSFAPKAFLEARKGALAKVLAAFSQTDDLCCISAERLIEKPQILEVLRMVTAPPLAQDRLVGLSHAKKSMLISMEAGRLPRNSDSSDFLDSLGRVADVLNAMLDRDLFPWLASGKITPQQRKRSAAIVADRLTGIQSDPIIRNEQEMRQFRAISKYLESRGYRYIDKVTSLEEMRPKSFSFHVNVPVVIGQSKSINMPIDVLIQSSMNEKYPLLVECKSAGDFTNTNKRRKEEAVKMSQLKATYGDEIGLCLFLCGYFDTGYLGYEAAEGIDWIWEHRISDFEKLGI